MSAFSKWQVAEMTKNPHIFLEMPTLDVSVLGNKRYCVPKQLPCSKPLGKAWSSLDFEPVLMPLLLKFYHANVLGSTKGNYGKLNFIKESEIVSLSLFFFFRYGGPCSQSVRSVFAISWISYLASKEGIVIALVDGRGTAFQGDKHLYAVYRKLGVYEVEDQITAVR